MTEQGAALQSYNNDLVKCLEELCERRSLLQKDIDKEEQEKHILEAQLKTLQDKLARVDASLSNKMATKAEYDKTISVSPLNSFLKPFNITIPGDPSSAAFFAAAGLHAH